MPESLIFLTGNRMRTEAGKMPESLIFLTENSPGVSNDRFGFKPKPAVRHRVKEKSVPKPAKSESGNQKENKTHRNRKIKTKRLSSPI